MGHPPPKLWGLALAGILTEMNSAHHHELGMWGRNDNTVPWCRNSLRDFYGVEDKEAFAEMAQWLATTGHSAAARRMARSIFISASVVRP